MTDTGLDRCLRTQGDPPFVPVTGEGGCVELAEAFASRFFNERLLALVAFILLPVMAGMFLGAPVVARELEQGTHQLVWTQGVSRTRWAVTKLVMLSLILLAVAGLFALMVEWWFEPLNRATGDRFTWLIFDQQGSVLAGYALFAFALGVLAGAVTRRTVRAMGITLASFFVVRFAVAVWIRPHYLGTLERTYPLSANRMPNPFRSDFVIGGGGPGIGGIYDAPGRFIKGGQTFCLQPMPAECVSEYGHGAYNLEIFQPASRYWLFQGIETLLFIGLAAALLVAAIWWIRRRLT